MKRSLSSELKQQISKTVTVSGWVNSRRDHGGLIFIDLRDHEGINQLVVTPETAEPFKLAETLRDEFVKFANVRQNSKIQTSKLAISNLLLKL